MKRVLSLATCAAILSILTSAHAQQGHPRGPQLTEDQRNCLGQQGLPDPQSGQRPSREQVEAAFQACGIQLPQMPPHGFRRGPPPQDESNAIR